MNHVHKQILKKTVTTQNLRKPVGMPTTENA